MKNILKTLRSTFATAAAALVLVASPAHAQIPVTDLANLASQIQQYASMVADYTAQYEHYKNMIERLKAITGARDIASLLGIQEVKDALSESDFNAISSLAATLTTEYGQWENPANDKNLAAMASVASKAFARIATINDLKAKAGSTMDAKEGQALNARLAAEHLKLQNETINMMALQNQTIAKEKQIALKKDEALYLYYVGKTYNPFSK
jgi:hypothetical protein